MARMANVVGGGIGGVATAASLAQRGFKVTLFERAPELREVGAGIFVKENSLRVIEGLGRLGDLERAGTRLNWGELWTRGPRKTLARRIVGHRVYVLPRQALHALLISAAVDCGVDIQTRAEVADVDESGTVTLRDGRRFDADVAVGADGINSLVRERHRLGARITYTGAGSWRTLIPFGSGDPLDGVVEYWNGSRRVLVIPAGEGITYLCASSRDDDGATAGSTFDSDAWANLFPEFGDLIRRVDAAHIVRRRHSKAKVRSWHRGRVAILGDAVHGQPPNLGQGAGLAIANGASLAEHLAQRSDVEAGLRDWEIAERPFTEAVQDWSNKYDDVVHGWPLVLEPVRTAFVGLIGRFPPTKRRWAAFGQGLPEIMSPPRRAAM